METEIEIEIEMEMDIEIEILFVFPPLIRLYALLYHVLFLFQSLSSLWADIL